MDLLTDFDKSQEILDNCDTRHSPFYDMLKNHKSLFFDVEMNSVIRLVKQLSDIMKRVERRFERCDTYNLSKSLTECVTRDIQYTNYPWLYYDFRYNFVRVCIVRVSKSYYIHVDGVPYDYYSDFLKFKALHTLDSDARFVCPIDVVWSEVDDVVPTFSSFCVYLMNNGDLFDDLPLW